MRALPQYIDMYHKRYQAPIQKIEVSVEGECHWVLLRVLLWLEYEDQNLRVYQELLSAQGERKRIYSRG